MKLFFELIQVALGNRSRLSSTPTPQEWEELYAFSLKQGLVGIAFSGIERLPQTQRPVIDLTYPWNEDVRAVEANNLQVQRRTEQLLEHLEHDGFCAFVLKGQSFGNYYPEHLRNRRTAGDIDVWMWPKNGEGRKENGKIDSEHRAVIQYCLSLLPGKHVCYIHIDFPVFSDVPVEAHIRPSFLCNPFKNRQLQRWFEAQKATVLTTNPLPFHLTCCELHLFKHLFEMGFGMRQLLDYYILWHESSHQTDCEPEEPAIKGFRNAKFHNALIQLVSWLFESDLDDARLNSESRFLMNEVLLGGNFGQSDPRIQPTDNAVSFAWEKLKHNFRLIRHYPSEVLWEPLFRLYHWYWRQQHTCQPEHK